MGTLNINILGTSFSIQAKEDDRYLENLLARYKTLTSHIENASGLKDNLKIAIMAGISLCDELHRTKYHNKKNAIQQSTVDDTESAEAERITLKLIENIDRILQ
ncbi:cell division protein ZapA [Treponema sp. OMZ 840]|uniref:cell division protein ZapA n=1 Tax=Treponema sp. OMZ 840 TaxID=244313 RepID=UPI003D8B3D9E